MNMDIKRALVVAAHPDDDILGVAGVMNKYQNDIQFRVIFIAEGTTCRFDNVDSQLASAEIQRRNSCGINALKHVGVTEYEFYNLPCGRLDQVDQIVINKIIESEIELFKPDTVFTHSTCDSNKDHHKVYDATIIATRPGSGVRSVLSYEVLSSTEWGFAKTFSPNVFVSLSYEDVQTKWKALSCYESEIEEFPHPRSKEGIMTLAKLRGMQSSTLYAEAFRLVRHCV